VDFFVPVGYVKVHVYEDKPRTVDQQREEEIRRVVGELDAEVCRQAVANFLTRTEACQPA